MGWGGGDLTGLSGGERAESFHGFLQGGEGEGETHAAAAGKGWT